MSRLADPHRALCRSVLSHFRGDPHTLHSSATQPWSSVTFTGARHQLAMALNDSGTLARARAFVENAHAIEFELPGHIVADVLARLETQTAPDEPTLLHIEALTVEAV